MNACDGIFLHSQKYSYRLRCAALFAHVIEERRADIALAQVGQHHHN
jgi:hypothetical protein